MRRIGLTIGLVPAGFAETGHIGRKAAKVEYRAILSSVGANPFSVVLRCLTGKVDMTPAAIL